MGLIDISLDEHGRVKYSRKLRQLLQKINDEVNRLPYKTDMALYNKLDYWTDQMDQAGAGDCDDYALTKRRRLIEEGLPWQCLSPAICKIQGEGHAVLLCRTTKGPLVLDNNVSEVTSQRSIKVQGRRYEWLCWLEPVSKTWFAFS